MNGDLAGIQAELVSGADASFGDDVNYSPLHAAAQEGQVEAVRLLLTAGADPNKADEHGNGPLWTAVHQACLVRRTDANLEVVRLLLAAGADPDHMNNYGRSPRENAELRDKAVAALFPSCARHAEPGAAPDRGGR
jgi:ankyrin repeat protein